MTCTACVTSFFALGGINDADAVPLWLDRSVLSCSSVGTHCGAPRRDYDGFQ